MKVQLKKIIEQMPKDLSDIEKARYIYIELGKRISYNLNYSYATDYRYIMDTYTDFYTVYGVDNKYDNKIFLICTQASQLLSELLNMAGVRNRVVGYDPNTEHHVDVVIEVDGKEYLLNLIQDAAYIQKGFRTRYFATQPEDKDSPKYDTIPPDELDRIDKNGGLCKFGLYTDDVVAMLKRDLTDPEVLQAVISENHDSYRGLSREDAILKFKLDIIYRSIPNNCTPETALNLRELKIFYNELFNSLLTKEEKARISHCDFYDPNKMFGFATFATVHLANREIYYACDDETRQYREVTEEEVKKLVKGKEFPYNRPDFDRE